MSNCMENPVRPVSCVPCLHISPTPIKLHKAREAPYGTYLP